MNPNLFDRRSFMRSAITGPVIAGGLGDLCTRPVAAQQPASPFADLFYIMVDESSTMLSVLDNDVWFKWFTRSPKEIARKYEQALANFRKELTVKSQTPIWRYRNEHIIAYYPYEERVGGRYVPGVEGKYLTADYSTLPPRVVLTSAANEWSRWEATPVEDAQGAKGKLLDGKRYVRNLNGRNQDAWLAVSKNEFFRDPVQSLSVFQPILSFDEKAPFYWRSYRPDDTSK